MSVNSKVPPKIVLFVRDQHQLRARILIYTHKLRFCARGLLALIPKILISGATFYFSLCLPLSPLNTA